MHSKGLSKHLKQKHQVDFLEYVMNNLDSFPEYRLCAECGTQLTLGVTCSVRCKGIRQSKLYKGQVGWSRGLTKENTPGLKSMAEKAGIRGAGVNIWERMSPDVRNAAKNKLSIRASQKIGDKNPMYGRRHSPETIHKIFKYKPMNKFERWFADMLDKNGIPYKFQYFLSDQSVYSYDFKILNTNILVELDGDFWHGNPDAKNVYVKSDIVKERDKLKTELAIANGYAVVRIWESEYKRDKNLAFDKILSRLNIANVQNVVENLECH